MKKEKRTWKIYYWRYDEKTDKYCDQGFRTKEYKRYGNAVVVAHKLFDNTDFQWIVDNENPFIRTCRACEKTFKIGSPFCRPSYALVAINVDGHDNVLPHYRFSSLCPDCARRIRAAIVKLVSDIKTGEVKE